MRAEAPAPQFSSGAGFGEESAMGGICGAPSDGRRLDQQAEAEQKTIREQTQSQQEDEKKIQGYQAESGSRNGGARQVCESLACITSCRGILAARSSVPANLRSRCREEHVVAAGP